jgi:hypothetical protein
MANELGDHGDKGVFFVAALVDDDGAVGEELEGAAGGGFIDAADLGDGGDGDSVGWVAEGGNDALLLVGEAGEEVAKDELEGIIALRATAQVGEGVGNGGAVAAADLPGGPDEDECVAAGLGDEMKSGFGFSRIRDEVAAKAAATLGRAAHIFPTDRRSPAAVFSATT